MRNGETRKTAGQIVFFVLLTGAVIAAVIFLLPDYKKNRQMELKLAELERRLAESRRECLELKKTVHGLSQSPREVEKVAREKFGLCAEGEIIYRYETDSTGNRGD